MTENQQEITPGTKKSKINWIKVAIWGGLIILLSLILFSMLKSDHGPVKVGSEVPDFTLTTFDGNQIRLSDQRGKIIVLNFWASWCKPCEQEAADLEVAWQHYKPRGDVLFLGVAWTDTEPNSLQYLEQFNITYPNGPDLGTKISQLFRTTGVPETYIIDKDGKLAYIKISPFTSQAEIYSIIDSLLE